MKKKKLKIPNKERIYSLHNFYKQFEHCLVKVPDRENYEDCWIDYFFEKLEEVDACITNASKNTFYETWTIRDNNDNLVMKVDCGRNFVNKIGYFLQKL